MGQVLGPWHKHETWSVEITNNRLILAMRLVATLPYVRRGKECELSLFQDALCSSWLICFVLFIVCLSAPVTS